MAKETPKHVHVKKSHLQARHDDNEQARKRRSKGSASRVAQFKSGSGSK